MKIAEFSITDLATALNTKKEELAKSSKMFIVGACALAAFGPATSAHAFGVSNFFDGVVDAVKGTANLTTAVVEGAYDVGAATVNVTKKVVSGTANTIGEMRSSKSESSNSQKSTEATANEVSKNQVRKTSRSI